MEITRAEALAIAQKRMNTEWMIFDDITIEKSYGWIFFYGAKDPNNPLAGNCPFMVDKQGVVHVSGLSSAYNVDAHIASFDRLANTL